MKIINCLIRIIQVTQVFDNVCLEVEYRTKNVFIIT